MGAGNKGKGGKAFRSGKGEGSLGNRNLILKEESQAYARVKRNLGCFRLDVTVDDGSTIKAIVRGTMREKKAICAVGSTILISFRETGENVADVIHLYKDFEVKELASKGLIPSDFISQDDDEALRKRQGEGYTIVKQNDMSTVSAKLEVAGGSVQAYDPLAGMDGEDETEDMPVCNTNKPVAAKSIREAVTANVAIDDL